MAPVVTRASWARSSTEVAANPRSPNSRSPAAISADRVCAEGAAQALETIRSLKVF
jgi:hypothetical protein